ncbi:hypothetical protein ACHQM5_000676 [Ranunculus cassubicifolius]
MADELREVLPGESSKRQLESDDEDEEEIDTEEEQELQIKQMAQLIQKYRSTIPDRIKDSFSSLLIAQRPPILPSLSPVLQLNDRNPESVDAEEDGDIAEKIELLKKKISSNVSAFPTVLKRVNDCISRFDKLDSYNVNIHPAFKKKRTS